MGVLQRINGGHKMRSKLIRLIKIEDWKPERKAHEAIARHYRCSHIAILDEANRGEDVLHKCYEKGLSGFTQIGRVNAKKRIYGFWT